MLCELSVDALLTLILRWSDIEIDDFAYTGGQYFDYGQIP